ncbi:hypothetical protein DM02DRAFT_612929 [Periconia macrospinosa]|uniref:Mid2 domain-containing protein n=1 Tax=Periconia macrospinosa TaxID=97972 RepID=A0A2V1DWI3_9PLEO|nr:hypothetical protein DM02DRAFT_612929 [Periconia macrospinosa]
MPRLMRASSPLLFLLSSLLLSSTASALCFRPNGSVDANPEYVPCSTDLSSPLSNICCATNRPEERGPDICTPNGLCQVGVKKGEKPRDPTWTKPQCKNKDWKGCMEVCGQDDMAFVTPCDTAAGNSSRRWCCGYQNTDCCNEDTKLAIETLALKFGDPINPTSSSLSPISLPTAATGVSSLSPPPLAPTNPSSPTSSNANTAQEIKPEDEGISTGAKAGLGIGIALAILAILAAGYFLGTHLRNRKNGHHGPTGPYNHMPNPYAADRSYPPHPQYPNAVYSNHPGYQADMQGRGAGAGTMVYYKYEADDATRMELPEQMRYEVDSSRSNVGLAELPGDEKAKVDVEVSVVSVNEKAPR